MTGSNDQRLAAGQGVKRRGIDKGTRYTNIILLSTRFPHPLGDTSHPFPLFEKFDAFSPLHGGLYVGFLPAMSVVDGVGVVVDVVFGGHEGRVVRKHNKARKMSKGIVSNL